jgi:hypothetical protein
MKRLLAVADTDSYLKWAAATVATMPAEWVGTEVCLCYGLLRL